ncbi:Metallothionein-like protein [Quillaja saponaria]|uniref:Metallothionein-like protein n=1 Tax=Quillaja saponaria TaxID=32244 RepID=A0AAD7KXJ7_QUISA|nr:Metallothionein-like protein [Quillaja saponaria]
MSCSCGSNCGCGSNCNCGSNKMYPSLDYSEKTTTETIIAGVAPVKMFYESSEMSFGAENNCKCGSNCSCDPCGCK